MISQGLIDIVIAIGKEYTPALLPASVRPGRVGDCFDHCLLSALTNPHLKYVEGIARPMNSADWKLHAWLTDGTHVYDPTWTIIRQRGPSIPFPGVYVGIEMETKSVCDFVYATGYKGVIANFDKNIELAEKALNSKLFITKAKNVSQQSNNNRQPDARS